jgi:hypothetical protein
MRRHPRFGPTVSPKVFWVIRSRRDTWHTIGLYRHFSHRDFEEKGSASSQPRYVRCEGIQDSGPHYHRKCSGSSNQGETCGARLGSITTSPIVTLKSKDQLPPIHEMQSVEGTSRCGPMVIALGHTKKGQSK